MQVERVRASLRAEADDRARLSLQPAKIDIFIRVNARGHATPKRGAMLNNRGGKSTQAAAEIRAARRALLPARANAKLSQVWRAPLRFGPFSRRCWKAECTVAVHRAGGRRRVVVSEPLLRIGSGASAFGR